MKDTVVINSPKDKESIAELIDLSKFQLQNRIGQGTYGKVYKAKDIKSGKIYAAKILSNEIDYTSDDELTEISSELNIISKLNHPSVLKFIGFSLTDFKKRCKPVIVTEYASNGSLEDLILTERNSPDSSNLDDTRKLIIIYGIASAMSYLHSHDILHRDLKPGNILIDYFLFPKIADFGLSKVKQSNIDSIMSNSSIGSVKGTPIYMSPEIWENSNYSKKSDVYAFAIICYELLTNEKPFDNNNYFEIMLKIHNGYRPEFKKPIPESYQNLIKSCWLDDPSFRPTFDEIVYRLKNDRGFITEKVNEKEFLIYINYIDDYEASFDQSKKINCLDIFTKITKRKEIPIQYYDFFTIKPSFFTFDEFNKLEKNCQNEVKQAGNDCKKLYKIGKSLFKGKNLFPRNPMIAIQYLEESMNAGLIESAIYYCKQLIKGDIIHHDTKKAKKLLEIIKDKKPDVYYLLCGKICKKEKNYDESRLFFEKAISLKNAESMFEYGRLILKNKLTTLTKEEGIQLIEESINLLKFSRKAMFKYGIYLLKGDIIAKNEEKGIHNILRAASVGYKDALYFCSKELTTDELTSYVYLRKAAYKGHIEAMNDYGRLLYMSKDDELRKQESIIFLKKATEAGQLESMYLYGSILQRGSILPIDYSKSTPLLKIAARNGVPDAMMEYASNLLFGKGVETDEASALKYIKEAAEKGSYTAMFFYAYLLDKGEEIEMNKDEAAKYYKILIDKGFPNAMYYYALMCDSTNKEESAKYSKMAADKGFVNAMIMYASKLNSGDGIEINIEESAKYLKMAVDKGNLDACYYYANKLLYGDGVEKNINECMKYLRIAAEKGHVESMFKYSFVILKDDAKNYIGIKYLKMAADEGHLTACYCYALYLYENENNIEEYIKYLKIAAEKGQPNAMNRYAMEIEFGNIIEMNTEESVKYYKKAADKGVPEAMYRYALKVDSGEGIEINKEESTKYYKMAADNGFVKAMIYYALMVTLGYGVEQNKEEGLKYVIKAIEINKAEAFELLKEMGDQLGLSLPL